MNPVWTEVLLPILTIVVLVLLNGVFVAAAFAIVASKTPRVQQQATEGNKAARRLLALLKSPGGRDRYIAVCQLGITLSSIGLGMYGEQTVASWMDPVLTHRFHLSHLLSHTLGTVVSLALVTYLHVVLGEMVPKALALQRPEGTVYGVDPFMRMVQTVFRPVTWLLNTLALGLMRLLRIRDPGSGDRLYTSEELEFLVEESAEQGKVDPQDQQFIEGIFDFGDRQVGEVMTQRTSIQAVNIDASPLDLQRLIEEGRFSRHLVVDQFLDRPLGYIHIKDLIRAFALSPSQVRVADILRPVMVFPETTRLTDALFMLKKRKTHLAVVEDEIGGTAGIITLQDIIEEVMSPDLPLSEGQ